MRLKSIDLLRLIALLYMFFQHMVLILLSEKCNNGPILFFFNLVPVCPALFLFVSGFSVSLVKDKYEGFKLNLKLIKRGLILILLSSMLFFIENGFQLPDIFTNSGILNTIGLMLVISSLIILLPNKEIFAFLLILTLVMIQVYLEKINTLVIPFNNGYEPVIPTITFGFIGLFSGFLYKKLKTKNFDLFILASGAVSTVLFMILFYFNNGFNMFLKEGTYDIVRIFNNKNMFLTNMIYGFQNGLTEKYIWNYKAVNFFASLSAVFMTFSIFYFIETLLKKYLDDLLLLPSRFALANYIFHFIFIIILMSVFGYNSFNTINFIISLSSLFLLSYIFSFLLYQFKKKKMQ